MFQKVIKIIDLYYINLLNLLLSQKDILNRKQRSYMTQKIFEEKKKFSHH